MLRNARDLPRYERRLREDGSVQTGNQRRDGAFIRDVEASRRGGTRSGGDRLLSFAKNETEF